MHAHVPLGYATVLGKIIAGLSVRAQGFFKRV